MLKKIVMLLFIFSTFAFTQNDEEFARYYDSGMDNYRKKDYSKAVENFERALQLQPPNVNAKYNLACAYSLNGNKQQALALLNELVDNQKGLDAENDSDFSSLRDTDEFKLILEKINKAKKPFGTSITAFTIAEKDLIPEGITYDPKSKSFLLGSLYKSKIVRVDKSKKVSDFILEKQEGIWQVVGMKVDSKRDILWAASSAGDHAKDIKNEDIGKAGIFKFDLKTGKLIKKYLLTDNSVSHFFNDITIANNGDIYVTDSNDPCVYVIEHNSDALMPFMKLQGYNYPNGIAISDDNKLLFVAHSAGVGIIDLKDKKLRNLNNTGDIPLDNIDGMYYFKNSLVAIQNFGAKRIARFYMDEKCDSVTKVKILESYNPDFNIPTTGTIIGDEFYYIANSQLGSFDNGKLFPIDKLKEVIIKKVKL